MVSKAEQNKIKQVAKEYEKLGYNVIIEPRVDDLPSFLRKLNYHPDLVATSGSDKVIIEIKERANDKITENLNVVAAEVSKEKEWRFELIFTTSNKTSTPSTVKLTVPKEMSLAQINERRKSIEKLIDEQVFDAAYLLAWSLFEAVARHLIKQDKRDYHEKNSLVAIKTLFSYGYLVSKEYDLLQNTFKVRNRLVHGFETANNDIKMVLQLVRLVDKLLSEIIRAPKQ
jgi:Holliday junction resolvase